MTVKAPLGVFGGDCGTRLLATVTLPAVHVEGRLLVEKLDSSKAFYW